MPYAARKRSPTHAQARVSSAVEELVLEQRSQRDSYSFDRPLLSASLSLSSRHPILSDLRELSPLLESERLSELPR